ncbi:MAG: GGDEF domain-containing protein [Fibrobacter sp.]|nr:GGDEF domain-containing protein [Fibrobacter sp.]
MKFFSRYFGKEAPLEQKMFWAILVVVTITAMSSTIFTVLEGMSFAALAFSAGCVFLCLLVAAVAVKTSLYTLCYLVMCCSLSCFLLPMLFVFCGGIASGMPLYFVGSLMLLAFAENFAAKIIAFLVSMVVQLSVIVATWISPNLVADSLDRDGSYLDILVTLVLTGLMVFIISVFVASAYVKECKKNKELAQKLDYLTTTDVLTGLWNRRSLVSFLENVVSVRREEFYLLMIGVDCLKWVNETYTNPFGDQVLLSLARLLSESNEKSGGGYVARYGGDKFVYLINASSESEAETRTDKIKDAFVRLRWQEQPNLQLTVSGGFVSCANREFRDYRQMLSHAEDLLHQAIRDGGNQIRRMG